MARILEDEIANDPLARGYSGMTDAQLLSSLNAADRTRNTPVMSGAAVKSHVDKTEYAALSDAKKQQLIELLKRDDIDLNGLDRDILVDIFGASTTGTALNVAKTESVSRATELKLGTVTEKDLRMNTLSRKVPS